MTQGGYVFWAMIVALILAVIVGINLIPPSSDETRDDLPISLDLTDDLPASPTEDEVRCLALALYHEARGEPSEGMRAIAHVVVNRAASPHYPNSVCGVIKDGGETPPCQFSWWCDGRSDNPRNRRAFTRAEVIALLVLSGGSEDLTDGATYFHANNVSPYWSKLFTPTVTVGGHTFYRDDTGTR